MKIELDEPKAIHHNKPIVRHVHDLPSSPNFDTLPIAADKPAHRMIGIASLAIVVIGVVLLVSITLISQAEPQPANQPAPAPQRDITPDPKGPLRNKFPSVSF